MPRESGAFLNNRHFKEKGDIRCRMSSFFIMGMQLYFEKSPRLL